MKDLFYLISIPIKNENKFNLISNLKAAIIKSNSIQNPSTSIHTIELPAFKYSSLAASISLSEQLDQLDHHISSFLQNYLESSDSLNVTSSLSIDQIPPKEYLNDFKWNNYKYKRNNSNLFDISHAIVNNVNSHNLDFKNHQQDYQIAKGSLNQLERKQLGNLSTKSLAGIISQSHVVDSEFLQSLFIAVPLNNLKDWFNSYERMGKMVVPRSSNVITTDSEFALVNVSVFRKYKQDFSQACRENRFIVREFQFDPSLGQESSKQLQDARDKEKFQYKKFTQLLKVVFSETFQALAHIKFLRLYIESVLRYGLPTDYLYVVIDLDEKSSNKLLPPLIQHFAHLSPSLANKVNDKSGDVNISGEYAGLLDQDIYPFPLFALDCPRND